MSSSLSTPEHPAAPAAGSGAGVPPDTNLRRVLVPLVLLLVLLVLLPGAILWQQHRVHMEQRIDWGVQSALEDIQIHMELTAKSLGMALTSMAINSCLRDAMRMADRERLLADWEKVYEELRETFGLTHFLFLDPDQSVRLRLHDEGRYGDQVDRYMVSWAAATGERAAGLDLGGVGLLVLRVVQPVREEGELLGFIELGVQLEQLLAGQNFHRSGTELYICLRKSHLDRSEWEREMQRQGRTSPWNQLPDSVVQFATRGYLPEPFAAFANHSPTDLPHGGPNEVYYDGRLWRLGSAELPTITGEEIGCLLIMQDVTEEREAFARVIGRGGLAAVLLLALLTGSVTVFLQRTDRRIQAQQRVVREGEKRFRALSRRLQDVREEENRRIAVWLHDEIGQLLTRARMDVMLLEDTLDARPEATDSLVSLKRTLDDVVQMIRLISIDLRPPILDDFGLIAALEWSFQEDQRRMRIPVTLQVEQVPDRLPEDLAVAFYRIARECMTNIARHAQAQHVEVRLQGKGGEVTMEVQDDGCGMSAEVMNHPASFGLAQLRERAEMLHGKLEIDSRVGHGTRIRITAPIDLSNDDRRQP
jgi:signal transduction histidine kinase